MGGLLFFYVEYKSNQIQKMISWLSKIAENMPNISPTAWSNDPLQNTTDPFEDMQTQFEDMMKNATMHFVSQKNINGNSVKYDIALDQGKVSGNVTSSDIDTMNDLILQIQAHGGTTQTLGNWEFFFEGDSSLLELFDIRTK